MVEGLGWGRVSKAVLTISNTETHGALLALFRAQMTNPPKGSVSHGGLPGTRAIPVCKLGMEACRYNGVRVKVGKPEWLLSENGSARMTPPPGVKILGLAIQTEIFRYT